MTSVQSPVRDELVTLLEEIVKKNLTVKHP